MKSSILALAVFSGVVYGAPVAGEVEESISIPEQCQGFQGGTCSAYETTSAYETIPTRETIPTHENIPAYETTQAYESAPVYKPTAAFSSHEQCQYAPSSVYESNSAYQTIPSFSRCGNGENKPTDYESTPAYETTSVWESIPAYETTSVWETTGAYESTTAWEAAPAYETSRADVPAQSYPGCEHEHCEYEPTIPTTAWETTTTWETVTAYTTPACSSSEHGEHGKYGKYKPTTVWETVSASPTTSACSSGEHGEHGEYKPTTVWETVSASSTTPTCGGSDGEQCEYEPTPAYEYGPSYETPAFSPCQDCKGGEYPQYPEYPAYPYPSVYQYGYPEVPTNIVNAFPTQPVRLARRQRFPRPGPFGGSNNNNNNNNGGRDPVPSSVRDYFETASNYPIYPGYPAGWYPYGNGWGWTTLTKVPSTSAAEPTASSTVLGDAAVTTYALGNENIAVVTRTSTATVVQPAPTGPQAARFTDVAVQNVAFVYNKALVTAKYLTTGRPVPTTTSTSTRKVQLTTKMIY